MSFKVSVIKKNQLLAWLITTMLCVAGYLNYVNDPRRNFDVEVTGIMQDDLGDAVLVNSNELVSNIDEYIETSSSKNSVISASEYFAEGRIERNKNFASRLEIYEKMLENNELDNNQKNIAQQEIKNINLEKNAISIAENLIKLKGFKDVLLLQNENSVNIIVAENELTDEGIAQIQNIIQNELGTEVQNIHISNL